MRAFAIIILLLTTFRIQAEEIISAAGLLAKISEKFKTEINDLEADIQWTQKGNTQTGKLYFKNPHQLRINFTEPEEQVISTNGYELLIYIASLNVVLKQELLKKQKTKDDEGNTVISENPLLLNPVGLDQFLENYAISYHQSKSKVKHDDGIDVYQFKLIRWKSSQNGFNRIYLTVQENGIIRKVEGITAAYQKITLQIDQVKINQNMTKLIFEYEPPAHTNTVENFILNQGDS